MNKDELMKMGLSEENADKVLAELVPQSKLKEKEDELSGLKTQLSERDEQLKELAKITKDNKDLSTKIEELQETNKNAKVEYEKKLASLRLDNGIELALTHAGAINNKAAKALLDLEKIKFENDKLIGLDEQLKTLKENETYLFKQVEQINPKGSTPATSNSNEVNSTDTFKSYEQILSEL